MCRDETYYDAFRFLLNFRASITLSYPMHSLDYRYGISMSVFFTFPEDMSLLSCPATHRHSHLLYYLLLSIIFS